MILESVFNSFFTGLEVLLSFLPDIHWNVNASFFTAFFDVLNVAVYFLPVETIAAIFVLIFCIHSFRIVVSILKTIMAILPFC